MEQSFGQLTGGGKCAVHIQVRSQLKLCAAACAVKFRALKSVQWSFNAVCAQFQSSTNAGKIVLNNRITNQRRTKNSNTKLVLLHMSDMHEVLSLRDWLQWKICTARIVQNFNSDNGVQWCTKVWGNGAAVFKRDQAVAEERRARKELFCIPWLMGSSSLTMQCMSTPQLEYKKSNLRQSCCSFPLLFALTKDVLPDMKEETQNC